MINMEKLEAPYVVTNRDGRCVDLLAFRERDPENFRRYIDACRVARLARKRV